MRLTEAELLGAVVNDAYKPKMHKVSPVAAEMQARFGHWNKMSCCCQTPGAFVSAWLSSLQLPFQCRSMPSSFLVSKSTSASMCESQTGPLNALLMK